MREDYATSDPWQRGGRHCTNRAGWGAGRVCPAGLGCRPTKSTGI